MVAVLLGPSEVLVVVIVTALIVFLSAGAGAKEGEFNLKMSQKNVCNP
ncbi:MAG: hypothetical protein H8E62_10000 [Planctomycetes bacterium]|nr:hypothetical protein [Planctomycetota bacterium]